MKNIILSIVYALLVWALGVSLFLSSFYVPVLENTERQADIVLALGIIPSATLGTYLFYRKGKMNPSHLALLFVVVAVLMDLLITVPVFIIPAGGSYSEFFQNTMFYTIAVEFYFIVFYFGKYLTKRQAL
ncbi:DUF5367 family protein [Flammeovirga sp. SJP92]|uniref:DUF5367 family protein n=1 Tax=Flammeovirga sp. SJP92 TaxID=1775430 RepID=UPI000786E4AD|nr:DUF5367 family protein [Flammeovirga sp. SJP92]KXX66861.1 hypothetical protein AVL50_30485 [Flammeovirga sp. SJP92]